MYVLLFLVMVNGHTDRYVIDHGLTAEDCSKAVAHAPVTDHRYADVHIRTEYRCVKVR